MPAEHALCRLDEIADGRARGFEVNGLLIAVYRSGEQAFAISGRCPHAAGLMAHGWIDDGQAVCPLHRWHFRLDTGRCTSIRGEWIRRFDCQVIDGRVVVRA
jgi:nitrite reductase/ring-hydroxylating ferredoxin subunit